MDIRVQVGETELLWSVVSGHRLLKHRCRKEEVNTWSCCGLSKSKDKKVFQTTEEQHRYIRHTYFNVTIDQLLGSLSKLHKNIKIYISMSLGNFIMHLLYGIIVMQDNSFLSSLITKHEWLSFKLVLSIQCF